MKYFFKSPLGSSTVTQPVWVHADEPYDSAERTTEPGANTAPMLARRHHRVGPTVNT